MKLESMEERYCSRLHEKSLHWAISSSLERGSKFGGFGRIRNQFRSSGTPWTPLPLRLLQPPQLPPPPGPFVGLSRPHQLHLQPHSLWENLVLEILLQGQPFPAMLLELILLYGLKNDGLLVDVGITGKGKGKTCSPKRTLEASADCESCWTSVQH